MDIKKMLAEYESKSATKKQTLENYMWICDDIGMTLQEFTRGGKRCGRYLFKLAESRNKVFLYRLDEVGIRLSEKLGWKEVVAWEESRYFFSGIEVLDYDFEEYRYAFPMTEEEFRGLETEWNKARSVIRKEWRNGI